MNKRIALAITLILLALFAGIINANVRESDLDRTLRQVRERAAIEGWDNEKTEAHE